MATLAQPSAPVETSGPAVPDADALRRLLATYQRLVESAGAHRSIVAVGSERFAVEHVRRALATLERRFSAHAAVSENGAPETSESRERIRQFLASLPPPQSRFRWLLLAALVLVVARPVIAFAGDVSWAEVLGRTLDDDSGRQTSAATKELADAVTRVSDLNLGNLSRAVDVVFITNLLTTAVVAMVFGAAAYFVLRPLAGGAIAFRMLHAGRRSRWPWYRAEPLGVRDDESAVFEAAGMRAPGDPKLDLAVKACVAVPLLLIAIAWWGLFLSAEISAHGEVFHRGEVDSSASSLTIDVLEREPVDAVIAVALGLFAVLRLSWLVVEWIRRGATRRGHVASAIASVGVLALAFGVMALRDTRSPSIVVLASPLKVVASSLGDYGGQGEGRPASTLGLVCDEPCTIESVWLLDENQERTDPILPRDADTDLAPSSFWTTVFASVQPWQDRGALESLRSSGDLQTIELHLRKAHVRALEATDTPQVELEVRDSAGHLKRPIVSWFPFY